MSTTALIRSSSSSNTSPTLTRSPSSSNLLTRSPSSSNLLTRSPSSSNLLTAPARQPKPSSPSPSATTTRQLPNISPTPPASATPSKPPTPQSQNSPAQRTPGNYAHPRIKEIIERQRKTQFDQRNVYAILYNAAFILLSFLASTPIHNLIPTTYITYTLLLLRLYFLANIGLAITPLLRATDNCEDIPLTPSQRKLLGLPPMSRPATPQEIEQYITPPRYASRNSSTSSLLAEAPTTLRPGSASPSSIYRQSSQSPVPSPRHAERRVLSFSSNRSSPLSISEFEQVGGMSVNTPTKVNNPRASVGLNSKWLYEKGRGSPGAQGWGSGSVFS